MAVSKVVYGGNTLIDLTQDTAVEQDVLSGKYFHKADGTRVQGTNTGGITPSGTKSISENGTYDVTSYASAAVSVTGTVPVFGRSIDVTIMPVDGTEETTLTILARTPGDPGSEQNLKFSSITPEQVFDPDDPQYFDYQATVNLVPGVGDGFFLTVDGWSIGSITAGAQYFLSRTVGTQKIYYVFINDNNLSSLGIDLS